MNINCLAKKTIVIILCITRSGSTLLKALLAEAGDVSHLPEVDYRRYTHNRYCFYFIVRRMSRKRINVLKKPFWFPALNYKWPIPPLKSLRPVFLVRDVYDTVKSPEKAAGQKLGNLSKAELAEFWYETHKRLLSTTKNLKNPGFFLRYEDLVARPVEIKQSLYCFMGSHHREGTDSYQRSEEFNWGRGRDDAEPLRIPGRLT